MPSVASLEKQQYYGFGRNAFWKVIYAVLGREPDEDYELRRPSAGTPDSTLGYAEVMCKRRAAGMTG